MGCTGERIYAFIDSQNVNLSVKNDLVDPRTGSVLYRGWRLDFAKFHVYLRDKYQVTKAFLFIGRVAGNEGLYRSLREAGYQVIYKPTIDYWDNHERIIKGNVDAELVLQAMIELPNYQRAIIVAGDGDYHCLIEFLADQDKLLHVIIPNRLRYSSLLKSYHRYFVYLNDLKSKLEYRPGEK